MRGVSARAARRRSGPRPHRHLGSESGHGAHVRRAGRDEPVPAQALGPGAAALRRRGADSGLPDRFRLSRRRRGEREPRRGRARRYADLRQVASHRVHGARGARRGGAASPRRAHLGRRRRPCADAADLRERPVVRRGRASRSAGRRVRMRPDRAHRRAGRARHRRVRGVRRRPPARASRDRVRARARDPRRDGR